MIVPMPRSLCSLPWIFALAVPAPGLAQEQGPAVGASGKEANPPEASPASAKAPSADTLAATPTEDHTQKTEARRKAARFMEFDKLRTQGQTTDFPGVGQTLTKDAGGVRSWLYDHDLYFRGVSSNTLTKDVSENGLDGDAQSYTGQKLTFTQSNELRLSWKVGGSGEDITQINVGGLFSVANWRQLGPSGARFSNLTVFSSFLDRTFEVKAGYNQNLSDFVGIFAGGNPILASGVAGSIPLSTGMSGGTALAPSFNVQFNAKSGFYSKSAIQRSILPEGMSADAASAGAGLKFTRPGAKALFIQEVGVRRASSPNSRQIWLRGGGSYNTTLYDRLDGAGRERNWSAYALADYQVYQPDAGAAYKGVYLGASALFAKDAVNVYKRSLEGRVYALGLIPGRPADQVTITVGLNSFSRTGARAVEDAGGVAHESQFSLGALYAFHALDGLFISPSVNYIRNPSFVGEFKPAINLGASATVLF
ncbi:carbohydrate porin [Sphingobium sp.]|uniref:carbohydrate porin n=1 Tax=Sphingobium sp. TaxID=1912891 RepID=UPI002BD33510|nr:carbohydrate porin [Sphingobium sp.]HUD95154.1 carbohydrate porin [Sphingobium sp.]